jgi:hypothetical protein
MFPIDRPLVLAYQLSGKSIQTGFACQPKLVKMGIWPTHISLERRRFWQRLVGAAAIYALILQPLLLSLSDAQLANSSTLDGFSLSQVCQHAADGSPISPADPQKDPADHHCDLCFARAFHLLDAPRSLINAEYVSLEIRKVLQLAHPLRLSSFARYSVARPRGPPFCA